MDDALYPLYSSYVGGSGATRPLPKDGSVENSTETPTIGPCPKVWTRSQKWKQ